MSYKIADIAKILEDHPYIKIIGKPRLVDIINIAITRYWSTKQKPIELLYVPDGYVGANGQIVVNEHIAVLSNGYIGAYTNSTLINKMASIGIYGVNMAKLLHAVNVSIERIRKIRREFYKYLFSNTSAEFILLSYITGIDTNYIFNKRTEITIESINEININHTFNKRIEITIEQ